MIRYKVKTRLITDLSPYKPVKKKEVFIVRENTDTGVWIPSKLSEFIIVSASGLSINTKKNIAYTICEFMNFLIDKIEDDEEEFKILKEKGLYGLKLIHATKFLNYISKSKEKVNNYDTAKKKEGRILDFYYFLQNKTIIKGKDAKVEVKLTRKKTANGKEGKKLIRTIVSPFEDLGSILYVQYPPKNPTSESIYKNQKPKLSDMDIPTFALFLEFAEKEYPDIALQVYIQCMGGLRCGETMNLTLEDVKQDRKKNRLFLNIQDRQVELFGKKNTTPEVKFERENQVVFNFNNKLFYVLDRHLSELAKNKKINKTSKNNTPLFVNDYGKPMSEETYRNRFNDLKNAFIEYLDGIKPSVANELREHRWSTHIGRHLFTNYIIKTGLVNDSLGQPQAKIVAALRGDTNINSALKYLNSKAILEAIDKNVKLMSSLAIDWNELIEIVDPDGKKMEMLKESELIKWES